MQEEGFPLYWFAINTNDNLQHLFYKERANDDGTMPIGFLGRAEKALALK